MQSVYLVLFISFFFNQINKRKNIFILDFIPILILFPIWQRYIIFDYGLVDFSFGILAIILVFQLLKIMNFNYSNNKKLINDIFIYFILLNFIIISKTGITFVNFFNVMFLYTKKYITFYSKNILNLFY